MNVYMRARDKSFDFDSDRQVQGTIRDQAKEELNAVLFHTVIDYLVVLNVIAFGAWLCKWWYFGGFHWGFYLFARFAPAFWRMVTTGQL